MGVILAPSFLCLPSAVAFGLETLAQCDDQMWTGSCMEGRKQGWSWGAHVEKRC